MAQMMNLVRLSYTQWKVSHHKPIYALLKAILSSLMGGNSA